MLIYSTTDVAKCRDGEHVSRVSLTPENVNLGCWAWSGTPRVNALCDQVEWYAERWSQLKSKDDVMAADISVCATVLKTVKKRKAELQQLMTEWEKLKWVCVALRRALVVLGGSSTVHYLFERVRDLLQ